VSNNPNDTMTGGTAADNKTSTGEANAATTTTNDQLFGTWSLDVKTPFGQYPATLTLVRGLNGEATGSIKSQLGDGALRDINPNPNDLSAIVTLTLQGRAYDGRVSARVEGGQLSGTIKVNNLPIPAPALKFTGRKQG
jgi:hypothetical protein